MLGLLPRAGRPKGLIWGTHRPTHYPNHRLWPLSAAYSIEADDTREGAEPRYWRSHAPQSAPTSHPHPASRDVLRGRLAPPKTLRVRNSAGPATGRCEHRLGLPPRAARSARLAPTLTQPGGRDAVRGQHRVRGRPAADLGGHVPAAVSRAAPHHLAAVARGRRIVPPGRGIARAPRRAVPGRVAGILPSRARGAARAHRDGCRARVARQGQPITSS